MIKIRHMEKLMNEYGKVNFYGYGELLSKLLHENNISISNLRFKLKLSSRTSIVRILNNECRAETVRRFHRILTEHRALLPFTDADYDSLTSALEITCGGRFSALVNWRMQRLVDGDEPEGDPVPPLTGQLLSYRGADEVRVYIVNCCSEPVADALIRLKRELSDEDSRRYSIRQFLRNVRGERLSVGFLRLYPLLTWECYRALYDKNRPEPSGSADALEPPAAYDEFDALTNYIVVLCKKGGTTRADLLYMSDKHNPDGVTGISDRTLCEHLRRFFGSLEERSTVLNTVIDLSMSPDGKSLESGSRLLMEAESSWQTILLKPDVCVNQIPPDIIRRVLNDSPVSPEPAALEALLEIQRRRYETYLDPSRHEVIILSREGLEGFAETGMLTDHPIGAAALKPDEIIRVLSDLVEAERHIGGFYVYVADRKIECSVKLCGTDRLFISELGHPGGICLVKSSAAAKLLTDYIFTRLIPGQAMSREDSIRFICGLIDRLRDGEAVE